MTQASPPSPPPLSKTQSANRSIGAILIDAGRLKTQDAEKILELQTVEGLRFGEAGLRLGVISENDILFALALQFNHPYIQTAPQHALSERLVSAYRPFSAEGEKLRALRSQLQMRWFDEQRNNRSLAIVSPASGDGRSYLAANLAIAFAQCGDRTLLIDGDMRNPGQHALFGLDNDRGLSRLLAGRIDDRVVNFIPGLQGLGVLTAGPTPPNTMELLSRNGFDEILKKSMASFDVVIIDTPACSLGPDAALLSRVAGGALLATRAHHTRAQAVQSTIRTMQEAGTKLVGSVLLDPAR